MSTSERFLNLMTGIASACAVIVTSVIVYRQFAVPAAPPAAAARAQRVNRVIGDWSKQLEAGRRMGPATAPVTILYYGDFECPACGAFSRDLELARREYPADLSVVFRHLPLAYHRFAYPSARAAECAADQDRFEAMYRTLYALQDSLGLVPYDEIARRAGVPSASRFSKCMQISAPVPRIENDRIAAKQLALPGTPGIIINGALFAEHIPTAAELEKLVNNAPRANHN
jgi:protein-disulfide isomerase